MACSVSTRSGRRPFGSLSYVGGNRLTTWSHSVAPAADGASWTPMTNRLSLDGRPPAGTVSVVVYCFQLVVSPVTVAVASACEPSLFSRLSVSGPVKPSLALAQNDAL